jgi:Poly(ADP-ribose) polymerase catalytic domain.
MEFYSMSNSVQRIFALIDSKARGLTDLHEPPYMKSIFLTKYLSRVTKSDIIDIFRTQLKNAKSDVVNVHDNVYYNSKFVIVLETLENRAEGYHTRAKIYHRDDLDWFIVQDVLASADTVVTQSQAVSALQDLWLYQFNAVRDRQSPSENMSSDLQARFLDYLSESLENTRAKATVAQVADFYLNFHANTLSDKDDQALNWLVRKSVSDVNQLIDVKLQDVDEQEKQTIIETFNTNSHFTHKQKVVDVFAITVPDDALIHDMSYKHIQGVHGTNNESVLSILQYGLKNLKTLEELQAQDENVVAHTKGEGLGRGVYFARPEQAQKSAMYQSGDDHGFMFIADIAYKTTEIVDNYVGERHRTDADLVIGDKVGTGGIDELVAKRDELITLQYVVVTKRM